MLRAGHGVILITAALLTIGVVMVSSAGATVDAGRTFTLRDVLLGRQALLACLAFLMMVVGTSVPLQRLSRSRHAPAMVGGLIAAMLVGLLAVYLPGVGREVNGARRWIDLGVVSFQPSEVAKWGLLIVLAAYAARYASRMGEFRRGLLPPMMLVGAVCGLVILEDLGTAVLIGVVAVTVLLAAGIKLAHVAVLAAPAGLGLAAAILSSPYRLDRIRAYLDPYQDPQGIGYHMIQSMATVAGGGLAGRGLGNSVQKFGYLPEDTTDFIFAIICEELGLVGATVVVLLYVGLLLCGWSIIRRIPDSFARLLGLGILITIGLQTLINIAVVTGLGPTKGIALPLVSAGGTGWVMTAFCMGLLVSLERGDRSVFPFAWGLGRRQENEKMELSSLSRRDSV